MKTIELITSGKQTTVFLDRICFIREKSSTETTIRFCNDHSVVAKISYNELKEKIKQL